MAVLSGTRSYPVPECVGAPVIQFSKACLPVGRDRIYDPIVASRLRGRSRYGAAKARLDHKRFHSVLSVSPW